MEKHILFIRHGESIDDVTNQYGGWSDFPLTEKGEKQIEDKIGAIKELDVDFDIVLSSPLLRAQQSADIIAEHLDLDIVTEQYVKERNTYGVLSGMVKEEAVHIYPDQVEKLNNDEYVDGSERIEDIEDRVERAQHILESYVYDNIVVVTHGNFLKAYFNVILGKKLTRKEDGGFFLVHLDDESETIVTTNGIEYK